MGRPVRAAWDSWDSCNKAGRCRSAPQGTRTSTVRISQLTCCQSCSSLVVKAATHSTVKSYLQQGCGRRWRCQKSAADSNELEDFERVSNRRSNRAKRRNTVNPHTNNPQITNLWVNFWEFPWAWAFQPLKFRICLSRILILWHPDSLVRRLTAAASR